MHTLCRVLSTAVALALTITLTGCGGGSAPLAEPTRVTTLYVVQSGDTLGGIAQAYHTTPDAIIELNADQYPQLRERQGRLVVVGWELRVPVGQGSSAEGGQQFLADESATGATVAVAGQITDVTNSPRGEPEYTPVTAGRWAGKLEVNVDDAYQDENAAAEIVVLTNSERSQAGVGPLTQDPALDAIAQKRATEIVWNYSHEGMTTSGENINFMWPTTASAASLVSSWKGSPGHYANMIDGTFTRMGAAVFRVPGVRFAGGGNGACFSVQVFEK